MGEFTGVFLFLFGIIALAVLWHAFRHDPAGNLRKRFDKEK